jgi:hypothetical protein
MYTSSYILNRNIQYGLVVCHSNDYVGQRYIITTVSTVLF